MIENWLNRKPKNNLNWSRKESLLLAEEVDQRYKIEFSNTVASAEDEGE